MRRVTLAACSLILASACNHTDAYLLPPPTILGPYSAQVPIQLTRNAGKDYSASWTEDGKGILYQFTQPGDQRFHRCIGLLPADGDTQVWHYCGNLSAVKDSSSSFSAAALSASGELIYLEATARVGNAQPDYVHLWLADTARPTQRRKLLDLPLRLDHPGGEGYVNWLDDVTWTGPDAFVVSGQEFALAQVRFGVDTIFVGKAILRGAITAAGATLTEIPGTFGALTYSLAQNGNTIVWPDVNTAAILSVPISGGTPDTVAVLSPASTPSQGIACRGNVCVVVRAAPPHIPPNPPDLWRIDLTTGQTTLVGPAGFTTIPFGPHLSPVTGAVVGAIGFDLYLMPALFP